MLHLPKGGHIRVGPHRQRQKDVASIETTICLIAQICVKLFQLSSHQHLQSASIRSNCRPDRNRFATFAHSRLESCVEGFDQGCWVVTNPGGQIAKIFKSFMRACVAECLSGARVRPGCGIHAQRAKARLPFCWHQSPISSNVFSLFR